MSLLMVFAVQLLMQFLVFKAFNLSSLVIQVGLRNLFHFPHVQKLIFNQILLQMAQTLCYRWYTQKREAFLNYLFSDLVKGIG